MKKIGLFYSPAGGSTEKAANKIAETIGNEYVDLVLVKENTEAELINKYHNLIFGISTVGKDTVDTTYKKSGWDWFMPKIENLVLKDKTIAIFGLGNHILYPKHFVDAIGILGKQLLEQGAQLVGYCPVEDYEFEESEAVVDGMFLGLPIDEDTENDLTDKRINSWVANILETFF
jgi:flavodoxin I